MQLIVLVTKQIIKIKWSKVKFYKIISSIMKNIAYNKLFYNDNLSSNSLHPQKQSHWKRRKLQTASHQKIPVIVRFPIA